MTAWLDVNTIFFTVLGYPLSYLEFFGTIFYLLSVWLITIRHMLTWPVGIVSVLLYMLLFYQIQLYSDALEQIYYLGASVYGWVYWLHSARNKKTVTDVFYGRTAVVIGWLIVTGICSLVLAWVMSNIDHWLPEIFPEPAAFPYLDALTTVMSFTAMWLMARRHVESWIYWIIVDVIGIGVYFSKDIRFVALLYVFLLLLALKGLHNWHNIAIKRVESA